jgi:hypothetical protein
MVILLANLECLDLGHVKLPFLVAGLCPPVYQA